MTAGQETAGGATGPLPVEVFMDYHCPYSHRVVCWLDDLDPGLVEVRYRLFALEQVNHDPDATAWRIWDQPLDYAQYRDRQDRRSLAPFLATAIVEASTADPGAARRLRRAIYAARFEARLDISDPAVLDVAGVRAGLPPGYVTTALAHPALAEPARARLAADWAAARNRYRVFGVPTIAIGADSPVYVRLSRAIAPAEGPALLAALRAFRVAAPTVLELKEPERVGPS
ncbi:MAG: DsbA family protein [Chloroflexi bacterium]|nr:DsbA family protein [Chloroflexota bacterium]